MRCPKSPAFRPTTPASDAPTRENVGFPGSPLRLYWRGKQGRMELS
jgi:hypothetical protein